MWLKTQKRLVNGPLICHTLDSLCASHNFDLMVVSEVRVVKVVNQHNNLFQSAQRSNQHVLDIPCFGLKLTLPDLATISVIAESTVSAWGTHLLVLGESAYFTLVLYCDVIYTQFAYNIDKYKIKFCIHVWVFLKLFKNFFKHILF